MSEDTETTNTGGTEAIDAGDIVVPAKKVAAKKKAPAKKKKSAKKKAAPVEVPEMDAPDPVPEMDIPPEPQGSAMLGERDPAVWSWWKHFHPEKAEEKYSRFLVNEGWDPATDEDCLRALADLQRKYPK